MTKTQAQATLPNLILAKSNYVNARQARILYEKTYLQFLWGRWKAVGMTINLHLMVTRREEMPADLTEDQKDCWAIFRAWLDRRKGEHYADSVGRVMRAAQERKEARP